MMAHIFFSRTSNKEGQDDGMLKLKLKKKKILISKEEFKKIHKDRIDSANALAVMEDELTKIKKRLSLRNKELKVLRIERAEHLRRIEQLEVQNESSSSSLKNPMSSSSLKKPTSSSSLKKPMSSSSGSGRWSSSVSIDYGYGNPEDSAPTNIGTQDVAMSSSRSIDYGYGDTEDASPTAAAATTTTIQNNNRVKRQMSRRGSTSRRASICVVRHDNCNNNPDGTSTTTTTTISKTSSHSSRGSRSRNNSRESKSRNNSKNALKRPSISYNNLVRQNSMDENSIGADEGPSDTEDNINERRPSSKCRNNGTKKQAPRRTSTRF
jgi:hypothetical protein